MALTDHGLAPAARIVAPKRLEERARYAAGGTDAGEEAPEEGES